MKHIAILSPHLDDGVFSCGEYIRKEVLSGNTVTVVTVFSGEAEPEALSEAAKEFHSMCFLHDDDAMAIRKQEDRGACEMLGCRYLYLDYPEYLYRSDSAGRKLCMNLSRMFDDGQDEETAFRQQLAARLETLCGEYDLVLAPVGVGGHRDHLMIRDLLLDYAERKQTPVLFYEDVPYLCDLFAEGKSFSAAGMEPLLISVTAEEWSAKVRASWRYFSQIQAEWRNENDRIRQMKEISSMYGPEHALRFWRLP